MKKRDRIKNELNKLKTEEERDTQYEKINVQLKQKQQQETTDKIKLL